MRRALLAAALLVLVLPGSALAHAALSDASPRFQQRLEVAPRAIVLRFDQEVTALPGAIEVRTATGRLVSLRASAEGDRRVVRARLLHLGRGPYTVRWHVLSGDGHVVSGVFTFGVRYAAPPPTEAFGASGPTRTEHLVRWAYFIGLALLAGGLGFRLLVLRGPTPPAFERRFYLVTGAGVLVVLEVGILAFLLRAEDALQLPFARFVYGDLSPIAGGTRFGTAFIAMTLGFAFVAALLFLGWLTARTIFLWPAFMLALGTASGLSLSGHSAADPGSSWRSELADWVHLSAASLWLGGLVQLVFVVWPSAPALRREAFLRFSRLAGILVALLVAAGVYLSILRLPHLHDLWAEGYGRVLLVKLGLVCVALSWGAFHHFFVRPLLETGRDGILLRIPRSLAGESAVGMAVLLAAAVLVDSRPPPRPAPPAPVAATANAR